MNEYFGFTQKDVDSLLEVMQAADQTENVRKWYDGYHFGEFDVPNIPEHWRD